MGITYGSATTAGDGSGDGIAGVSRPSTTADDILIADLYYESGTGTVAGAVTFSNGVWTLIKEQVQVGSTPDFTHARFMSRYASGGATFDITWNFGAVWRSLVVSSYRGVDTATAQDAVATLQAGGSDSTPIALGLTTVTPSAWLIYGEADFLGTTSDTYTSPLVERSDFANLAVAAGEQATAAPSGNKQATLGGGSYWTAGLTALRPATVAATITPPILVAASALLTPTVDVPVAGTVVTPAKLVMGASLCTARPSIVAAGLPAFTATNGATITPGLPPSWQVGNILLLLAARSDNNAMSDLSGSGWAQLSTGNNGAGQRAELWWKLAGAGETAPVVTFGTSTIVRGAIIIRVAAGTPVGTGPFVGITRSDKTDVSAATVTFADLTPSEPDTVLVALYAYEDDPSAASQITGWEPFRVPSPSALGSDMALGWTTRVYSPDDAATGALTTTVSGGTFANSPSVGFLIAVERTLAPALITPAQVTATSELLTPTVTLPSGGSATVSPPVLAVVASQLTPTLLAERVITITPPIITAVLSLLTPAVSVSQAATVTPSILVAASSLLTPTLIPTRAPIVAPALLALATSQLAPTLLATRAPVIPPALMAVAASLLTPTVAGVQTATVTPSMLSAVLSLSSPAISGASSAVVTPPLLVAATSLLTATATSSQAATSTPAALVLASSLSTIAVVTERGATITPSLLVATLSLPTSTVLTPGGVSVTPSMLAATLALWAPTVVPSRAAVSTPATLTATLSLPAALVTPERAATVVPSMLTATIGPLTPTVTPSRSATVTPAMLTVAVTLLTATAVTAGSVTVTPAMLTATLSLPAAAATGERAATFTPGLLMLSLSALAVTVSADRSVAVTPDLLSLQATLLTAQALVAASNVQGGVAVAMMLRNVCLAMTFALGAARLAESRPSFVRLGEDPDG